MNLEKAISKYVGLKRSLGAVFSVDERILRAFGRTIGDVPIDYISPEYCKSFYLGDGPLTRFSERKHQSLRGFFNYLVGRGYLNTSPLPEPGPKVQRTFQPYIYSHDELQRLLDATDILTMTSFALKPLTIRTVLLLIYGAGLRPGEALRMRCCDVDLTKRIITIWNTKFFKSRLVPIGKSLGNALEIYHNKRKSLPMPARDCSAFFATTTGKALSLKKLEDIFARLRKHAGIQRTDERCQPRLHDLRATFAVHRIVAWYREGADVQTRLPFLATYMGHVNISGTQHYLTMTPELLTEASLRFERYVFTK